MAQPQGVVVLERGAGRSYHMNQLDAVFKVDEETGGQYAVSEWWMQPGFAGVGPHSHEANDEVFYALPEPQPRGGWAPVPVHPGRLRAADAGHRRMVPAEPMTPPRRAT